MDHIASMMLGLGNGGVFAALAVAIVITYRSSGVVNFGTGVIALYVAYVYAGLRRGELLVIIPGFKNSVDLGSPLAFGPAAAIAMVFAAILGAVLYLVVFRPLRDAPQLAQAVASLGVLVIMQGALAVRMGTAPISVAPLFLVQRWKLGSVLILSDRAYLALAVMGLTLGLAAVYRFTRFGLVTQAVAESQTGAYVSRISPDRVALLNWMVSACVAGAAGILIAPLSPLTPITYTLFVVPALAAAVVGRFQYLIVTAVAGLGIGMLQSEAITLAGKHSWMPHTGASELVPLIVILIALLVAGRDMPTRGGLAQQSLGKAPRARGLLLPVIIGSSIGLVALLATSGQWRAAVIGSFIAAIIGLSIVVVTGYAGQVSLAQLALAGVAAFTLSYLTQSWHIPFPIAPLLAALVAAFVGVLIGLPALRLRGLTLGVVTLAFAYAIEALWFKNTDIVSSAGARATPPKLFGVDLSIGIGHAFPRIQFGLVCLFTLVLVAVGVALLRRSSLGSAMLAVRANERSAAGVGVNVVWVKVISFAIASFIAGLGGSLLAYRRTVVTYDSFTALGGLALLSTAYLAGVTSVWGGIMAGILATTGVVFLAVGTWIHLGAWYAVIMGVLLIVTLITNPEGLAGSGHALADRLAARRGKTTARTADEADAVDALGAEAKPERLPVVPARTVLAVDELTVRYGGVVAVNEVTLEVGAGMIVGLIGPNGAGKTSVIDAITGFAPARGTVTLDGNDISGLKPHARVRAGMGRTFQSLELYDDLWVEENVSVAAFGSGQADREDAIAAALARVGIGALSERPAGDLSQGERQLVSIARACVAEPEVLLLDEPAAGLDGTERTRLADRIRDIAGGGTGVLLVDHDVSLVLGVCDLIYVLDFGRVIAHGPPSAIRSDPAVAEAYLGSVRNDDTAEPSLAAAPPATAKPVAGPASPSGAMA
ncbi:ABC transporter permease subunit [Aquihabitans sp. McL0605]|uniref:ABC transporter permease subunit n=1 Tax=Aquihabitans sp. McL0605 TaxID=3415671 RepID=UPI003CF36E7C